MKRFLLIFLAVIFISQACQKREQEMQQGELSQKEGVSGTDSTVLVIKPKPINYDSMFVVLLNLRQEIENNPMDTTLRRNLLQAAYDTTWETIMAVGLSDSITFGADSVLSLRTAERAAKLDAYRWCAYIKRWKNEGKFSNFSQINANLQGGRVIKSVKTPDNRVALLLEVKSHLIQ